MGTRRISLLAGIAVGAVACAGPRPVLYPNARYEARGAEVAQADVDACMERARVVAESGGAKARSAAGGAAKSAVVGGATGAVVGAILGSPGTGAAAGAAGSATASAIRSAFGAREPDAVERGFVERCLREKGYDPIGWR